MQWFTGSAIAAYGNGTNGGSKNALPHLPKRVLGSRRSVPGMLWRAGSIPFVDALHR